MGYDSSGHTTIPNKSQMTEEGCKAMETDKSNGVLNCTLEEGRTGKHRCECGLRWE